MTGAALQRIALALVLCLAGALLFEWVGTVLPWMLGPMAVMAIASLLGLPVERPPGGLQVGQLVVGVALGLYFTAPVLAVLLDQANYILAAALFAFLLGAGCGWLLARLSGCDLKTAFFASLPGGGTEMSVLAEHYGARPDYVAAAHGVRVMLVVITIPPLMTLSGAHGSDLWVPGIVAVHGGGLALLILFAAFVAVTMRYLNLPNAWIIGPLFITVILTGMDISWSAVPRWMINGAQLLLGCALGSRFTPDFFRAAPRFLGWTAVTVYLSMALAAAFAWLLAALSGISLPTAVLATAPGGLPEMSVTAKVLQLGVPVVAAFHVSRMVLIILGASPVFALVRRYRGAAVKAAVTR